MDAGPDEMDERFAVLVLSDGDRKALESNWSSVELDDNGFKDAIVHFIKSIIIYVKHLESLGRGS